MAATYNVVSFPDHTSSALLQIGSGSLASCSTFLGLDDVSFSENGNDQSDRLIFKIHMTNAPLST